MSAEALRRVRPAVDPSRPEQVRKGLLRLLAERGMGGVRFAEGPEPIRGGYDTLIYGFRLEGEDIAPEWRSPLVVRIFAAFDQDGRASREALIQRFATARGYPALAPLVAEGPDNALGFPLMIVPRIGGGTLAKRMMSNPFRIGRWIDRMAELQIALHELSIEGCPLRYEGPLVDRRLADVRQRLDRHGLAQLEEGYAWLTEHKGRVIEEAPALCHADFHPLNILVDDTGDRLVLIDWAEVELGDRHFDLGRTLAAFWFAKLGAQGAAQRYLLQSTRGFLRQRYLAAYEQRLALDPERLAYWEAYHVFIAWLLVSELPFDTRVVKPAAVSALSDTLVDETRERFWECARLASAL
jgi:aminoglycoside phosphotransferase (APT) family kinase protein